MAGCRSRTAGCVWWHAWARFDRLPRAMALKPEKLDSVPPFDALSPETRKKFAVWVSELSVPQGKHLADQGDYAYELFVIEEGTAEVIQDGDAVAELGPGEMFGEMGVLEKAQRNATVI